MSIDNNKISSNFIPEHQTTNINSSHAEAAAQNLAADWKPWPDNSCDDLNASTSISNNDNMDMEVDNNNPDQGGMTEDDFFAAIRRVVGKDGLFVPIFIIRQNQNENNENMEQEDTQPRPIKTPRSRKLAAQAYQDRKE